MTKKAADDAAEVAQVAPDELFHQIRLRAVNSAADIEIHGGITWRILQRLEVCADRRKKLTADLIIQRQPGIELELPIKTNRAGGGQADVR